MMLSDEQMQCVTGSKNGEWTDLPLPIGRQQLPDWIRGAHVDWHDGVANSPNIRINVRGDVQHWEGQAYASEPGGMYISRHHDGRAQVHYHKGAVSMTKLKRFRTTDGKLHIYQPEKPGLSNIIHAGEDYMARLEPGEWVEIDVMATEQQQGYGGAHIGIKMVDGTDMVLRGPWHGGAPLGYVEVICCDGTKRLGWERKKENKPWWKRGIGGQMYITEDLFLRIVATYLPHIKIAAVQKSYGDRLEPYRAEWGALKAEIYDLEIERSRRKEPAGPFWRVYWDGTTAYCGSLHVPTYGFRDEVHEGDKPKQPEIDRAEALRKRRGF